MDSPTSNSPQAMQSEAMKQAILTERPGPAIFENEFRQKDDKIVDSISIVKNLEWSRTQHFCSSVFFRGYCNEKYKNKVAVFVFLGQNHDVFPNGFIFR